MGLLGSGEKIITSPDLATIRRKRAMKSQRNVMQMKTDPRTALAVNWNGPLSPWIFWA
jgi:hypothetical protein